MVLKAATKVLLADCFQGKGQVPVALEGQHYRLYIHIVFLVLRHPALPHHQSNRLSASKLRGHYNVRRYMPHHIL